MLIELVISIILVIALFCYIIKVKPLSGNNRQIGFICITLVVALYAYYFYIITNDNNVPQPTNDNNLEFDDNDNNEFPGNVIVRGKLTVDNGITGLILSDVEGNTAVGSEAFTGGDNKGDACRQNTAIGKSSLNNNVDGEQNTAVGYQSLLTNKIADGNTAIGSNALSRNDDEGSGNAGYNTAIGYSCLSTNMEGNNNTAIGASAGENITTGSYNICLGSGAKPPEPNSNGIFCLGGVDVKDNELPVYITGRDGNPMMYYISLTTKP
jgi:hypothetical protein